MLFHILKTKVYLAICNNSGITIGSFSLILLKQQRRQTLCLPSYHQIKLNGYNVLLRLPHNVDKGSDDFLLHQHVMLPSNISHMFHLLL